MRGIGYIGEVKTLFNSSCSGLIVCGCFKRGISPSFYNIPLPLTKGKGIQGIGLPDENP